MFVPRDKAEFRSRFAQAQHKYARRDQLVLLCNEMYELRKTQRSNFLGSGTTTWRTKVADEYWMSDSRPQNVVDVLTAVLAGNAPQWRAVIPGNVLSNVPSRAEKFMMGVFQFNARRQQVDLLVDIVFRTILDGGVGIRIFWDTEAGPPSSIDTVRDPGMPEGGAARKQPLATYSHRNFPIVIETIPISKLYPCGRGRMGQPFDEIFQVEAKTPHEAAEEWRGAKGANLAWLSDYNPSDRDFSYYEYVEWWGEDKDRRIWYACMFNNEFIIAPKQIDYPCIPYVLTTFKKFDADRPEFARVPFIYPILWATQRAEYLSSRNMRMADLFGNLPPIHRGDNPINLDGTWGDALEMGPEDTIEFPKWPGNPPDIYRMIEDMRQVQAEGTFSAAMFGQVSTRMSGYALSQLVGSDTLRTDTPKKNLELALSCVADIVFSLLQAFNPDVYMGVNVQIKDKQLSAILNGNETKLLTMHCFIKPRHIADDVKMASLGAQLASLPNPPVSLAFILENYFGVQQPEDEINRRLGEDVMKDPLVRLLALHKLLKEENHFAAGFIEQQLQQAIAQQAAPPGGPGAPGGLGLPGGGPPGMAGPMEGVGLGVPQAMMGNPPMPPPGGNVVEEEGMTRPNMMYGGPREEE